MILIALLMSGITNAEPDNTEPNNVGTEKDKRPNIVWILIEDWGPDLSCYGTKGIHTPNVDKLASEGIRYTNAFTTSPVCSTSRSAMMTGFHQNYIGAGQHRSKAKPLPYGIKAIPHLLEDAGYYTCLMSKKTDCNFTTDKKLFMGKDWKERKKGQPFYAQMTLTGTHRSWDRDPERPIDLKNVEIPPYYPDTEFVRRDWANGLEQMQIVDRGVGKFLQRLDDEGLRDNTLVFFIADHGRCHIRGKQFLYEGGLRVPLIVRWPGKVPPKQVSDDRVMSIDISATILKAAGVKPDHELHGKDLFGSVVKQRKYIFAARDKMDKTHDSMRMIRSNEFKLIHNLMPERAYCQYNAYKERSYPVLALMNVMHMKGQLNEAQARFMAEKKPEFELYDMRKDPHEINNLADRPKHAEVKKVLFEKLNEWREFIKDEGASEEFREGGNNTQYPTATLEVWEKRLEKWKPWVFRSSKMRGNHPFPKKMQRPFP